MSAELMNASEKLSTATERLCRAVGSAPAEFDTLLAETRAVREQCKAIRLEMAQHRDDYRSEPAAQ
jgi:hypothetical protein